MAGEMTALLQNRLSPPGCWQSEPHSSIIQRRLEALNRGIAKTKPGNIQGEAKGDAGRGMTLGLYGCHSMILEQSAGMPFNLVSSSRITFWTNIIESCRNISMV
ncbi:hypothetical protein MUK42_32585 [Musa troglodytarum]|uniref:Uncharacterized protein n=1 Tax=Musa troglodytarum TaxID=320322 RepID=A0A9E7L7K9_9LILI|nr:hypothetical protein MUK42_32585 [Musa troglodytarum]